MEKLKMRLFSDCYFYYNTYSKANSEDSKNEYWLKWKALYELIEAAELIEEYNELKNVLDSYSNK